MLFWGDDGDRFEQQGKKGAAMIKVELKNTKDDGTQQKNSLDPIKILR